MDIIQIKKILIDLKHRNLEEKIVDLRNYPHVYKEVTDYLLEVEEIIEEEGDEGIEKVLSWVSDDLEENIIPIINIVGGSFICLELLEGETRGVYYFNYDFGLFKLDDNIEKLIDKLEPAIDYDNLTDVELKKIDNGTFKFK